MERDPKLNPRRGDVLYKDGTYYHVNAGFNGVVMYCVKIGQQWLNSTVRVKLDEWVERVKDMEVIAWELK